MRIKTKPIALGCLYWFDLRFLAQLIRKTREFSNKMSIFYKFLTVCFLFFFSCQQFEKQKIIPEFPKKSQAEQAKAKEQKAWETLKSQKNKSLKNIEAFIQANKNKDIALKAYLLKARLFSKQGQAKKACLAYHQAAESPFDYTNSWPAYQASAKCYFREGKLKQALETLERLIQNPKESEKNKKASVKLQWHWLKNQKSLPAWKLNSLSHLLFFEPLEKEKWREKGEKLIQALPFKTLIRWANQAESFKNFEGYLLYQAGKKEFEGKEFLKAKHYFKKALSTSLSPYIKKESKHYLLLIKKISKVNPYLIGAIVPLSGRRKALGEKILRGLYMGLNMEKDSPWQIIVIDSKSHPDVARAQLDKMFFNRHIIGLVGGLTSETASALAERAEAFALPAVLLSQKKELGLSKEFIFQNAITAKQLLEPLIQKALNQRQIKTFAVLSPDDPYGQEYAGLFSEMLKESGGQIKGSELYKTGETDFKQPIKNLLHLNIKGREKEFEELKQSFLQKNPALSKRAKKLIPENLLPPKIEFSALFVPDSLSQVKRIRDHLKYFGVKDIYLLGTDLWRASQISRWPKEWPLVFVNLLEKPSLIKNSGFYKDFIRSYGHPPGLFEQRAYNTALFLRQALSQGARSRLALQNQMKKIKAFQGAYHKILVSKDRVFYYPLKVYETSSDNK